MLVDKNKVERHNVPHEAGEWVGLVALTGREMDAAKDAAITGQLDKYKPYIKEFAEIRRAADEVASGDETQANYDPDMLLEFAVKEWSYPQPVSPELLLQLDSRTRNWLHELIWRLNSLPLQTESA